MKGKERVPRIIQDVPLTFDVPHGAREHAPRIIIREIKEPDGQIRSQVVNDRGGDFVVVVPILVRGTHDRFFCVKREWVYAAMTSVITFAAGGIDKGETARQAAARELEEEFGYRVDPARLIPLDNEGFLESPDKTLGSQFIFLAFVNEEMVVEEYEDGEQMLFRVSPKGCRNLLKDMRVVLQRMALYMAYNYLASVNFREPNKPV